MLQYPFLPSFSLPLSLSLNADDFWLPKLWKNQVLFKATSFVMEALGNWHPSFRQHCTETPVMLMLDGWLLCHLGSRANLLPALPPPQKFSAENISKMPRGEPCSGLLCTWVAPGPDNINKPGKTYQAPLSNGELGTYEWLPSTIELA